MIWSEILKILLIAVGVVGGIVGLSLGGLGLLLLRDKIKEKRKNEEKD